MTDFETAPRKWEHQPGDRYVLMALSVVTDIDGNFEIVHEAYTPSLGSLEQAWRKGLRELDRSDDFNIGVIRDGELVAVLWHDEIVDDDLGVVAEIAAEAGL